MKRYPNENILVFSDPHLPYEDERMWDFLSDTQRIYKPDRIVCCGDLVDNYHASRYPKDPNHPDSWVNEQELVRKKVQKLRKIFPKMDITLGNHDDRYFSKAVSAGIPKEIIKGFAEVVGAPKGWKMHRTLILTVDSTREHITFTHHRGANVFLAAQRLGQTLVVGHQHARAKIEAHNNGVRIFFGVQCPSLVSGDGAPFAYTKLHNVNSMKGCTLIEEGVPRLLFIK